MKKQFFMLVSLTILLLGAVSFVSCKDDDNNDDATGHTLSAVFDKYKGLDGATIDGDDVVFADSVEITIYHFYEDKLIGESVYVDYKNEKAAKAAYDDFMKSHDMTDVQIEGSIVSYSTRNDIETMPDVSKEVFFNILTRNDLEGIVDFFDGVEMGE